MPDSPGHAAQLGLPPVTPLLTVFTVARAAGGGYARLFTLQADAYRGGPAAAALPAVSL